VDLTPRQRQVYEKIHSEDPPLRIAEAARQLGIGYQNARDAYRTAREKIENPDLRAAKRHENRDFAGRRVEYREPEKAAAFIDRRTDPLHDNLAEAARESGLPLSSAIELDARLDGEYLPVKQESARIKTDVLVREFEKLALGALESITPEDLEALDAYKRTLVAAIAVDKRELLDGRPTERISVEDRRAFPEVMALLMKEAERRGLMKEINPATNQASLVVDPSAPIQVQAGRQRMPKPATEDPYHA